MDMLNTLAVKKLKTECDDGQKNDPESDIILNALADKQSDREYDEDEEEEEDKKEEKYDDEEVNRFEGAFSTLLCE